MGIPSEPFWIAEDCGRGTTSEALLLHEFSATQTTKIEISIITAYNSYSGYLEWAYDGIVLWNEIPT